MVQKILNLIFGSKNERDMKKLSPIVANINSLEPEFKKLSDEELSGMTQKFRDRISKGESLDSILPEAFAAVREASVRTMGLRHYDVQLMGGIALHWGNIAEMKTGEGKTLTSTLAIYLNSLSGKGVHVVTVNDYLARRDATWMKPIYDFLKVSVGIIQHDMDHEERQEAYGCDITYGTNNEYGFDYLRDNMVTHKDHKVQKYHNFAIVDEVDSILIDEARTPLIISGPTDDTTDKYLKIDAIIPKLEDKIDFEIDEKAKNVLLTEDGVMHVERLLNVDNLYAPENVELVHHVHQSLKAHKIFQRDVDYVVQDGEVIIVDEFTGRMMQGRRYSDGLHQALEAKENVPIAKETQTLASITFQNFFRIYDKLSGMTGTADTEAEEFAKIYKLDVIVIPPNIPMKRLDHPDRVYRTEKEKYDAIVNEIKECAKNKQPVLVGTISIEKSEYISNRLKAAYLQHSVLNAKQHEREADIIANAGKPGAITIATNMAGRGTDIVLGGSPRYKEEMEKWESTDEDVEKFKLLIRKELFEEAESFLSTLSDKKGKRAKEILNSAILWREQHEEVLRVGGLHILGTERHESRRIDNQLRGRAGRQGDPGSSRFYLSLEDDLMRIFGTDRISGLMKRMGMEEGQEIEHKMVSNAIARSQKRVEGHNFDIRKHLLEYDDVMNKQRMFIYQLRNEVLDDNFNVSEVVKQWIEEILEVQILIHCDSNNPEAWHLDGINEWLGTITGSDLKVDKSEFKKSPKAQEELLDSLTSKLLEIYNSKKDRVGEIWKYLERDIILEILDHRWKEHLYVMDHLRDGIWTVGYGEKNPLTEYKIQGFKIFDQMVDNFKNEIINFLMKVEVQNEEKRKSSNKKDYVQVGVESTDIDIFSQGSGRALSDQSSRKKGSGVSQSAGGASKRKSGRRKNR
ncbi:MAG: preprotein translocase subunit SecA [Leptospiraceae bacterium]|nr:preprotein translocase subunit SecA [Leptospiraceae bacterium]MCP5513140.1 preprotein translocase subunit SecA [Leptospiraceae bacterium]